MIYILLPAYNEEASLPKLLPKIQSTLSKHKLEFRIIVVNDGSYDDTSDILNEFKEKHHFNLDVINHKLNRGLGETERDAFEYAAELAEDSDLLVRVEGDDTHDPKYIMDLINKINEGYDVVNTSRFQEGGGQQGLNWYRRAISRLANIFMKIMFGISGVRDYSCGYRAYRAKVIKDAIQLYGNRFIQLKGLGFTATLETIVKLNILGCRFSEIPFTLRYDLKESESKMVSSITAFGYFTMALLYHWPFGGWKSQYRGLKKEYQKDSDAAINKFGYTNISKRTVSRVEI